MSPSATYFVGLRFIMWKMVEYRTPAAMRRSSVNSMGQSFLGSGHHHLPSVIRLTK